MTNDADQIADIAARHGVDKDAVTTALTALRRGNGTMAQFSHPAFGGMAQWSQGGMSMVGDMFNSGMKGKLDGVMSDLAAALADGKIGGTEQNEDGPSASKEAQHGQSTSRWPEEFGSPSSSGSQNDMSYAFFPQARRLVVEDGGRRTIYDTGDHRISGVSQQQSGTRSLRFESQTGTVSLDSLTQVD